MVKENQGGLAKRERAMAKALSMSVLFQSKYYHQITKILDDMADGSISQEEAKAQFDGLDCWSDPITQLDEKDREWLWNYLKNYDKELAIKSDEKWPIHPDARGILTW